MSVEGRGWVTRVGIDLVNWQQEEPAGLGRRRQPSGGGTSRMSREAQVRICERLGVQLPGPTRRPSPFVVCHASLKPGWLTDDKLTDGTNRSSVPLLTPRLPTRRAWPRGTHRDRVFSLRVRSACPAPCRRPARSVRDGGAGGAGCALHGGEADAVGALFDGAADGGRQLHSSSIRGTFRSMRCLFGWRLKAMTTTARTGR